jgi:hypothetical protein
MNQTIRPPSPGPHNWSQTLDAAIVETLARHQVAAEAIDADTLRLPGAPLGARFNKPRANLLLRRTPLRSSAVAFVDSDLAYRGESAALAEAFRGECARNWRELKTPPIPGSAGEALRWLLSLLESPLAAELQAVARRDKPISGAAQATGAMLAFAGELLTHDEAQAYYDGCFRKSLARDLAVLTTRPTTPRCAVLWGEAGSGVSHAMLAAAWPLMENEGAKSVYRVAAAAVGAGCLFAPERDAALMALLRDALAEENAVLLIEDLDVCLTGSPICYSLLGGALDRGLRFLATFRSQETLRSLRDDEEAVARRLAAIYVPPASEAETVKAVRQLADECGLNVDDAAVLAAAGLTRKQAAQPLAALAQLGAVIAETRWQGRDCVGPDDVLAIFENQWPE